MKSKIALFTALALVAGSATAASWEDGFYFGGGVGYGKMNVNEDKISNLIDAGLFDAGIPAEVTKSSVGQGATAYSLTVGYQFMKYLAVEVGYIDLGNADYKATVCDVDNLCGRAKAQWDATGWPVTVLGIWPIDDTWSVFGRVGAFFGDVTLDAKVYDPFGDLALKGHNNANSNEFIGGVGVDMNFMENWKARLEWQALPSLGNNQTGDGNWNNIQVGLYYKF